MNWLAHLHLSPPDAAWRIGNLLPDLLPHGALAALPTPFRGGVEHHRAIDRFTDNHPVFRQSCRRIDGPLRRYGPILVDIFYDHFLSSSWNEHSGEPLGKFVAEFHASIEAHRAILPADAYTRLCRIRDGRWLLSYGDAEGVRATLGRLAHRLRRPVDLAAGADVLIGGYADFAADFARFYPELVRHSRRSGNAGLAQP